MLGSGRYARTDPWHAHDSGYDVRPAYRLVADALTRDPEAQNDGRGGGPRKVAAFLNTHPKIASVWYLGFLPEDHPDRPVFERQCKSPGSTFSFEVRGGEAEAFAVLDRLKVIKLAVSLGGTETLASHPAAMTHSDIPREERLRLGITPALIRISVGVEDPDDLIADLNQGLDARS